MKTFFYRLNVVPIHLPPLRERREDIVPLAEFFLEKTAHENHREKKKLSADARKKLLAYAWPGNVRELSNVIERAVVMDNGKVIAPEHLLIETTVSNSSLSLQDLEKKHIVETLQANNHNRTKAAEALGISVKTLRNKIVEYNIAKEE